MTIEIKQPIDENENYILGVVAAPDGAGYDGYGVVNKKWGVVEMWTTLLAQAKEHLNMLNKWELGTKDEEKDLSLPDMPLNS